jgi:hypothetical protein
MYVVGWRYDCPHFDMGTEWKRVGSYIPPVSVPGGKERTIPIDQDNVWALGPDWTFRRKESFLLLRKTKLRIFYHPSPRLVTTLTELTRLGIRCLRTHIEEGISIVYYSLCTVNIVIAVNDSVKSKLPVCVSKEEKDENLFFTNRLTTKHQMQKLFNTNQNLDVDRPICGGNMERKKFLYHIEKFNYLKICQHVKCQDTLASYRNTVTVSRSGEQCKRPSRFLKEG